MMTCYICGKTITWTAYWAPTSRVGIYAAVCAECGKKVGKEAGKEAKE